MANLSKADLHIHTLASDGTASAAEVLDFVANHTDLRLIAITDHDTIAGAVQASKFADYYGIEVIVGEEVSTQEGHLLALFIEQPVPSHRPALETIEAIHAQGGLAIAPHPFDRYVDSLGKHGDLHPEWRFDAIEAFNASVMWPQSNANRKAKQFALQRQTAMVGGSDAHTLKTIGQAYTTFAGRSANDLYRAIRSGQVGFAGRYWSLGQHIEVVSQMVSQHGWRGLFEHALVGSGLTVRRG
jgi:Predicted metal-dependent phosphoesterases (PHP family)